MAWEGIRQAGDAIAAAIRRNNERQWIEKERLRVEAERQRQEEEEERIFQRSAEAVKTAGAPKVGYQNVGMGGLIPPSKMATSITPKQPGEAKADLFSQFGGLGRKGIGYARDLSSFHPAFEDDGKEEFKQKLFDKLNSAKPEMREFWLDLIKESFPDEQFGDLPETPSDLEKARTGYITKQTGLLGKEEHEDPFITVGKRKRSLSYWDNKIETLNEDRKKLIGNYQIGSKEYENLNAMIEEIEAAIDEYYNQEDIRRNAKLLGDDDEDAIWRD